MTQTISVNNAAGWAAGQLEGNVEVAGNKLALSDTTSRVAASTASPAAPFALGGHAVVTTRNFIYAIGGTTGTPTSTVLRGALGANGSVSGSVTERALPSTRVDLAAAVVDSLLVVSGGSNTDEVSISAIAADGSLGVWQAGLVLPGVRSGHAMVAHRGTLYVLGGRSGSLQSRRTARWVRGCKRRLCLPAGISTPLCFTTAAST